MKTRVTITLDPEVHARAKAVARARRTTVSGLIRRFSARRTRPGRAVRWSMRCSGAPSCAACSPVVIRFMTPCTPATSPAAGENPAGYRRPAGRGAGTGAVRRGERRGIALGRSGRRGGRGLALGGQLRIPVRAAGGLSRTPAAPSRGGARGDRRRRRALDLPVSGVEDAFQAAAALAWQTDAIVTRNLVDYRRSPIPAVTPAQFLKRLRTS